MPTKVELAKDKLGELMARQQALVDDKFIGRDKMYRELKQLRNDITELVQEVAPY